jgi:hypothetical protein
MSALTNNYCIYCGISLTEKELRKIKEELEKTKRNPGRHLLTPEQREASILRRRVYHKEYMRKLRTGALGVDARDRLRVRHKLRMRHRRLLSKLVKEKRMGENQNGT